MIIKKLLHKNAEKSEVVSSKLYEGDRTIVKSRYSMISLGTEKLVSSGKVSGDITRYLRVPNMEGDFNLPCTYGYSLTGEVLSGEHAGKNAHILHPHQNFAQTDSEDLYIVPDDISPQKAVLASNLETAVNAIWDSRISLGDRVVVFGFGTVGAFTAHLASKIPGVQVMVSEINANRKKAALELGFTLWKGEGDFDVAFNTTKSGKALQNCIDITRKDGCVVELSWYGNQKVSVSLGHSFHYNRKRIISSQVSTIPPEKFSWNYKKRKDLVFDLLKDEFFDKLPVRIIDFDNSPPFFDLLRKGEINDFCVLIKY